MSERIDSLKRSVTRDEQRVQKLQETIKLRNAKIKELENAEILSNLNSLSAQGISVRNIIDAIKGRDTDTLMRLMCNDDSTGKSGTGSASINDKEDKENEQSV